MNGKQQWAAKPKTWPHHEKSEEKRRGCVCYADVRQQEIDVSGEDSSNKQRGACDFETKDADERSQKLPSFGLDTPASTRHQRQRGHQVSVNVHYMRFYRFWSR